MSGGKRLLATSMLVSIVVLSLANIQRRDSLPSTDQFIGLAIAFFFLSATSDLGAEGLANGFALLLMITILLTRGDNALTYVLGRAGGTNKPAHAANVAARQDVQKARQGESLAAALIPAFDPF